MSVVVGVVAESFAASVARVDADGVSAEEVNISHVSDESLACEERAVADLTLEIARQHVRCFVLYQRGPVQCSELAVTAVVRSLSVRVLGTVQADVLAQVPVVHTTVWAYTLTCNTPDVVDKQAMYLPYF